MKMLSNYFKAQSQFILAVIAVILISSAFILYSKNRKYAQANRILILQNDSILAENIELTRALKLQQSRSNNQKASLSHKVDK
jgi:hypothetical protein